MLNFKKLFVLLLAFVLFGTAMSTSAQQVDNMGKFLSPQNGIQIIDVATGEIVSQKDGAERLDQNKTYKIHLNFQETRENQFPSDGVFRYHIPSGLLNVQNSMPGNTITIDVENPDSTIIQVTGTYTLQDGWLTVDFSGDPNYHEL